MSYLKSFPDKYWAKKPEWIFRVVSRFWFTDKVHPENCKCEGCFLGDLQLELRL